MSQVQSRAIAEESVAVAGAEGVLGVVGRSPREIFWSRFRKDKVALVAAGFLIVLILAAALAPVISHSLIHHGPNQLFNNETNEIGLPKGPSGSFFFGEELPARQTGRPKLRYGDVATTRPSRTKQRYSATNATGSATSTGVSGSIPRGARMSRAAA